jgi:hypothetical protein
VWRWGSARSEHDTARPQGPVDSSPPVTRVAISVRRWAKAALSPWRLLERLRRPLKSRGDEASPSSLDHALTARFRRPSQHRDGSTGGSREQSTLGKQPSPQGGCCSLHLPPLLRLLRRHPDRAACRAALQTDRPLRFWPREAAAPSGRWLPTVRHFPLSVPSSSATCASDLKPRQGFRSIRCPWTPKRGPSARPN